MAVRSSGKAALILRPSYGNGNYASKAEVPIYSKDTINHLVLKLFTVNGEVETPVPGSSGQLSRDIVKADLDSAILIGNLQTSTTYRIRSYAYKALGTDPADLISDASSYTDVVVTTDDRPTMAGIPVKLVDRNFAGLATGSFAVTPGGYNYAYSEGFASYYNANYRITTIAGGLSPENAPATMVLMSGPAGVACDGAGNFYVSEVNIHRVRKVTLDGKITTIAGNGTYGFSGDGGPATAASMAYPRGIAADAAGNVYIADSNNCRIRKVTPAGIITTIAGNGIEAVSGDGGPATEASMGSPYGVKVDGSGNVYIADESKAMVRKVDTNGNISTVAGAGGFGYNGDAGTATQILLDRIYDVAVDGSGSVYIADSNNNRIRKVTNGTLTTIAGTGVQGNTGDGGQATDAQITFPLGILVAGDGSIVFSGGNLIRKIAPNGIITTLAGVGTSTAYTGEGVAALTAPIEAGGIALDTSGNLLVAEINNTRVRKIANGTITTVAGYGQQGYAGGYNGDGGLANAAWLRGPNSVLARKNGDFLISDASNYRIRKIGADGRISTIAGNGTSGFAADGSQATEGSVMASDLAEDASGNLYFTAPNSRVRKIATNGVVTTVAGLSMAGYGGDNVQAITTKIRPLGITVNAIGEIFIADGMNYRVRKVDTNGIITTIAGNGTGGYTGDGNLATLAQIKTARDVALDASGNLYISEGNNVIRKVDTNGIITTVAGNGTAGYNGDGIQATVAQLNGPGRITLDTIGNLYIIDSNNNRIRKVTPNGIISTIAGPWTAGYSGDNGPANSAQLNGPSDITVDRLGNVYVSDTGNQAIRKLD